MIGRDTIDRIRARIDLVALVGETVKLQRRGRSHSGLCPFHQEKSPSFTVSEERGVFYCFGCKTSGDAFKFVELTEGLSFGEALRKLAARAGIDLVDDRSDHDRAAETRARKAKDDLYGINALAAGYFERMLLEHPVGSYARDELARRGLPIDGDEKLVTVLRSFRVGYAPHGWDGLSVFLRQNGVSPAQAEQVGLLAPRSNGPGFYDSFRHRLMVAITDVQGRVVAFSGRALKAPEGDAHEEGRPPPPKYINSRESSIYSKGHTLFGLFQARNAIRARGEAVIVEGNFDLVAMHARGIDHVVAPLGTSFTPDQARLLRRFCSTLTLLFDADNAGRKATWAARPILKEAGISAKVARMPQGKDPDEFLQLRGPEAMADVLKAARSLDEVLIYDLCEPVGEGANLADKQAALLKIRPILEDQEIAFRDALARRIAGSIGVDLPTLWRLIRGGRPDVDAQGGDASSSARSRGDGSSRTERMERSEGGSATGAKGQRRAVETEQETLSRAIVETLLVCPELLDDPSLQEWLGLVTGDWAFAVVELRNEMRNSGLENRSIDLSAVLAHLPQAIQEAAAAKLADPVLETAYSAASQAGRDSKKLAAEVLSQSADGRPDPLLARRVIRETGVKLEKAVAQARYREIEREIDRAETTGDIDRATALMSEKARLAGVLRRATAESRNDPSN